MINYLFWVGKRFFSSVLTPGRLIESSYDELCLLEKRTRTGVSFQWFIIFGFLTSNGNLRTCFGFLTVCLYRTVMPKCLFLSMVVLWLSRSLNPDHRRSLPDLNLYTSLFIAQKKIKFKIKFNQSITLKSPVKRYPLIKKEKETLLTPDFNGRSLLSRSNWKLAIFDLICQL